MGLAPSASAAPARFRAPSPRPNAEPLYWEEVASLIGAHAFGASEARALGAIRTVVHWAGVVVSVSSSVSGSPGATNARARVRMDPRLFGPSQNWDVEVVLPRGVPGSTWAALKNEVVDFVGKIVSVQAGAPTVLMENVRIYEFRPAGVGVAEKPGIRSLVACLAALPGAKNARSARALLRGAERDESQKDTNSAPHTSPASEQGPSWVDYLLAASPRLHADVFSGFAGTQIVVSCVAKNGAIRACSDNQLFEVRGPPDALEGGKSSKSAAKSKKSNDPSSSSEKGSVPDNKLPEELLHMRDGHYVIRGIIDNFRKVAGEYVVLVRGASLERGRMQTAQSLSNQHNAAPRLCVDRGLIDQTRFLQQTAAAE